MTLCFLQVDHAKVLHYVGAGLAFPASLLFVCVQTLLSYRAAETRRDFQTAHLRLTLTSLAFTTLILNILYCTRVCNRKTIFHRLFPVAHKTSYKCCAVAP